MRPNLRVIEGGKCNAVTLDDYADAPLPHLVVSLVWLLWSIAFTIDALLLWYVLFAPTRYAAL